MQKKEPDNNNLLIAVILSMAVLMAWQLLYAVPKMREEQARQERAKQEQVQPQVAKPGEAAPPRQPGVEPAAPSAPSTAGQVPAAPVRPAAPVTRETALADEPRVPIDTPALAGSISLKGARIDDLVLKNYHVTADPRSPRVVLFSPADAPEPYFAEHGWSVASGTTQKVPDRDTVWRAETQGQLTPTTPLTLAWDNGQGLVFRRTITVDTDFMFRVVQEVENRTGGAVTLYPYARVYRYGTPQVQGFYILHEGLIGVVGDAGLQEITYSEALGQNAPRLFQSVTGGWLGITDKYWAAALVPNQTTVYRAEFSAGGKKGTAEGEWYQVDYLIPGGVAVPAGERRGVEGLLYAGAKQVKTVERYEEAYGIKQFDLMIDWGWFYFITKPLFYLIDWLYKFLGNFGLAILAVTVIVKALFFPLANKSYESMAKMKKLQPEMERIRERFKDDRARQQQELMSLYQKQKINPLAGCLPILLQIPVFFALYKVLFVTIDMRHAPFYGWIKDLSAPDPTSVFNLFGLLPYAVPEFLHVGAWPLIMGLTMWLQMQLNPPQPDPTQQMIFNWMPVLFTFLLASFPAGLVIYWAWNNVLSLAQQWYISKKQGADPHLIENLRRHIGTVMGFFGRRGDKGAKG
jgi:YidC/Oxa1 family membrane protein insertase